MEKKREDSTKTKQTLSEEERRAKLKRLMELKAKLEMAEKEESQTDLNSSIDATETWTPPQQEPTNEITIEELDADELYLKQLDQELQSIEQDYTTQLSDLENLDVETKETVIVKTAEALFGSKQPKEKTTQRIQPQTDIDMELSKLQQEIDREAQKAAVLVSIFDKLCEEHEWLKEPQYGFMYSMPNKKKQKQDFESWLDDWNKVLFDYARIATEHIIFSKKLLSEKPWSDMRERTAALQEISDHLVKKKLADWLDKKKESLRVYWKSLEEWADSVVKWAKDNAYAEPLLIQDIQNADEPFSSLPVEDIEKIFNIIDKQGKGTKHKLSGGGSAVTVNF